MKISPQGFEILTQFEGESPVLYDDATGKSISDPSAAKGNPTIGIGHFLTADELSSGSIQIGGESVDWRQGLSQEQMQNLARQDLQDAIQAVESSITAPLTQNQFDALVSFAFNIGPQAFKESGAIQALNEGDIEEFLRRHAQWNESGGTEMQGLINRRRREAELFRSE